MNRPNVGIWFNDDYAIKGVKIHCLDRSTLHCMTSPQLCRSTEYIGDMSSTYRHQGFLDDKYPIIWNRRAMIRRVQEKLM
ncbi:hypothetical protein CVS40_11865 [Lucilia cuprina]|nr:hypothetical protein CVS40_11865 [Lucilia cuprina]